MKLCNVCTNEKSEHLSGFQNNEETTTPIMHIDPTVYVSSKGISKTYRAVESNYEASIITEEFDTCNEGINSSRKKPNLVRKQLLSSGWH